MLCDLDHELLTVIVNGNGVEQLRQTLLRESDVHHRADDLHDFSYILHNTRILSVHELTV